MSGYRTEDAVAEEVPVMNLSPGRRLHSSVCFRHEIVRDVNKQKGGETWRSRI